jgi:recombination protein RecT
MANEVVKQESGLKVFNQTLANPKTQEYLQQVLGEKKSSFVNNLTALVANDKKLQACKPMSVMYAAIKATALDLPLDPNLGFAYVIPYKNSNEGCTDAQFQIGYKGFIQLAMRSGQYRTINVRDVRDGEIVGEDFVSGNLRFKKLSSNREKAAIVGYVAFFQLVNGFEKMMFWTVDEVKQHAMTYSKTFGSTIKTIREASKWTTDFDSMAKKTALKLLLSKYGILSVEMKNAITNDQLVVNEQGEEMYEDNPVVDAEVEELPVEQAIEEQKEQMRQQPKLQMP